MSDIPLFEKVLKQHWVRDYDGKKQDVVMIKDVAEAVRKLKEGIDKKIEYIKSTINSKSFEFNLEQKRAITGGMITMLEDFKEEIDKIFYPKKKGHEGEFKQRILNESGTGK